MKKMLCVLLCVVLFSMTAMGCGGAGSATETTNAGSAAATDGFESGKTY